MRAVGEPTLRCRPGTCCGLALAISAIWRAASCCVAGVEPSGGAGQERDGGDKAHHNWLDAVVVPAGAAVAAAGRRQLTLQQVEQLLQAAAAALATHAEPRFSAQCVAPGKRACSAGTSLLRLCAMRQREISRDA